MKTLILFFTFTLVLAMSGILFSQGVAINTTGDYPDDAALLDVSSINKGVLIPRMTTAQRGAIDVSGNPEGLLIYNTDRCCFEFYANGIWKGMGCPCDGTSQVTFTYNGSPVTYFTVESSCRCWLDRNLGASQVATSRSDHLAYGDLFQWGRGADGHQLINWSSSNTGALVNVTTTTLSSIDTPGHVNFIEASSSSPYDWRDDNNNNRWNATPMVNNPCPSGWSVPSSSEWIKERNSWSGAHYWGAFASPLKLPVAGHGAGFPPSFAGEEGYYWSRNVSGATPANALYLLFNSVTASVGNFNRYYGFSVRCIKDN